MSSSGIANSEELISLFYIQEADNNIPRSPRDVHSAMQKLPLESHHPARIRPGTLPQIGKVRSSAVVLFQTVQRDSETDLALIVV
mmetsp:Transcript_17446/g.50842  ORF Transcript_17446/g.50842 Transcript_17446/m.50842 type:complete len:85 (-) Transcript_17446:1583-1837(-)